MSSACAEIISFGIVQGVGYRYFCCRLAIDLKLSGWVQNLPDGSVKSLVEGDSEAIEVYYKELKEGPSSSEVSHAEILWLDGVSKYKEFEIKY